MDSLILQFDHILESWVSSYLQQPLFLITTLINEALIPQPEEDTTDSYENIVLVNVTCWIASLQIYMLKSELPEAQNASLFGN